MKNIIVTTVDSSGVVAKNALSDNGPTVINATKDANYEFFDNVKGYGPDHIITRRVDNDLKVSFDRTGTEEDLIIKDFYQENSNSALIGASKEGEPYYYIPDSAEQADFVSQLQDGAVQGNALGGEEFVQPWWIGGLPVLAALGIASIGSDDAEPPTVDTVINPPTVEITEDANNDGIISASELDGTVGVLITVHPETNVGDTLVITNPDGSMDIVVITQDIKDNGLVLEYPAPANGETIEVTAYVADQQENISEPSTDSAVVESPAIVSLSGDSSINENAGPATYTITLDKASDTDTVVTYEVQNQTTDSNDFTGLTTATVTIPAGEVSAVIEVGINDDGVYEGDENYNVVITEVTGGAQLGNDDTVNTIIIDTDMMPSVSVDDVTVSESLMGEDVVATFTVTLSHPSSETVEVSFNTDAGTAVDGADYTGVSGTVTFAPGETTQTIEVPILDDVYDEADETFNVVLSAPVNATLGNNGIGTITDEEQYPDLVEVSIVDNYDAVNEGDTTTFPIELRDEAGNLIVAATDVTVTVEYTGSATNGDDYTTVSTTVTILAGTSSVNLDIATLTDLLDEDLEDVVITITEATGGGFEAIGVDADHSVADVDIIDSSYTTIEINDVTVDEDAGNAVFTVTLTGDAPTADVTVNYATGDVTAVDASDYTGVTGTLVFPVGTFTQTITVPILDDNIAEAPETYTVTLSDAVNATILNNGVGTITDECNTDLDSVYVSIVDNVDSVYEGEVGSFTVELRDADGNLNAAITDVIVDIHYSGVAIDGTDYVGVASVTIPANSSSVVFDITTLDDYIAEGSEIVNIELSSVTGGGFEAIAVDPTKATADMEIVDECCDTEAVMVSIHDYMADVIEGGNGVFPIDLRDQDGNPISAITDTTVDVHYSGVAIDGTDFTGVATVVIPAGNQSTVLVLETIDDNFAEGSELVNIELHNVSGGGFESIEIDPDHSTADMNIVDDCDSVFVSILDFTTDVVEATSGLFPIVLKDADGNAINAVTDVTVNIEYSGVAIDGTDFTGIASVVIPAGAQSTNLILQTLDDNIAEGSEIVNIELTSVSGGGFEAIAVDPVMYVADMNIVDDCDPGDPVTVSIFDNVDSIYEGESTYFPISLTNADGDPQIAITDVTVTIEYTGSATNGDDYTGSFTVVIPADSSSVNLDINALEDLLPEGNEIVDITITNPVGGGFEDILVNPAANTANVTIIDSTVEIVEVSPAQATEGTDLVHTVTLSSASSSDSVFSFNLAEGTATENVDYSNVVSFSDGVTLDPVTGDITVPAGVTSFTVTYPTIDDSYADDGETTTLSVGGVTGEGTINDELDPPFDPENPLDPVTVCIVDDVDSINEWAVNPDNIGSFPIEIRDQNGDLIVAATDVMVDVIYSGTANNGDDFTGVLQVTIPAGTSSVNLDLAVIDDLLAEGDEVVNITISNPVGGGFEGISVDPYANTADMIIKDDDYIQIDVEPTAAFEGDDLVHMVTLSNPSASDETFSFSLVEGTATEGVDYSNTVSFSDGVTLDPVTGDITVPAGVTSFTVTYPTIDV
ncbi:Calx-beta domain-containing protein, partial [Psychrobacter phenylpyruvicus]|uniref:Calx-beta domain-containing protein n=1 Tax=Psychrobacter phenylpyruvicus TaxID=29432 RepID=UPI000B25CBBB